jgi:hypothetical protein
MSADYALAQPEPQEPTIEEIDDLASELLDGDRASTRDFARAVLARWGRPAIEPVPVSERLPGPEEGRCWWWNDMRNHWDLLDARYRTRAELWSFTAWLPYYALPVPQQQEVE